MKQRNPVVRHAAILRKGGVHTQSVSSTRHQSKRELDDEIDEYFNEVKTKSRKGTDKGRSNSAPSYFCIPQPIHDTGCQPNSW